MNQLEITARLIEQLRTMTIAMEGFATTPCTTMTDHHHQQQHQQQQQQQQQKQHHQQYQQQQQQQQQQPGEKNKKNRGWFIVWIAVLGIACLFLARLQLLNSVDSSSSQHNNYVQHATASHATLHRSNANANENETKSLSSSLSLILESSRINDQEQQVVTTSAFPSSEHTTKSVDLLLYAASRSKEKVLDEIIDMEVERERCKRYNYVYKNRTTRRRIFWGSLIADDSWHILSIAAMEYYGVLDTVAFVESNTTQSLTPREMRFGPHSPGLETLKQMWGESTRVSVDQYYDPPKDQKQGLGRENLQRDVFLQRWKQNGMREDDIGYISDVDEVATRDFLRVLQICEVPQLQPGQDCVQPKISLSAIVFEGSPMCLQQGRRWYHPDLILGECVDQIGNVTLHKPIQRQQQFGVNLRNKGWRDSFNRTQGPLWDATDFRMESGSKLATGRKDLHTAFHFHNFFNSIAILRNKYKTYGHPVRGALEMPLGELHPNDVGFMVDCLMNRSEDGNKHRRARGGWKSLNPNHYPIAFQQARNYPEHRHKEWQEMLVEDEKLRPPRNST
jgi:hypothetical protein